MKLADLTPDKRNANKGTHRGRKMIAESLRDYGAGRSILIDRDGNIIAGNKTAEGAKVAGIDEVQIVESDGTKLIAVKRTDLQIDSAEARALAIADNRASEVSLDWDLDVLKGLETEVDVEKFWTHVEFDALLGRESEMDAPEPQLDKAAELQEKWGTEPGQIWQIGEHRLMCGDSSEPRDVDALCQGYKAQLMATDPPYGVGYGVESGPDSAKRFGAMGSDNADGPKLQGFLERVFIAATAVLAPGAPWYLWHAQMTQGFFAAAAAAAAAQFRIHRQIIWVKSHFILGHGDFHWQHELCFYGWREGEKHRWFGGRDQSTLWEIPNPRAHEMHPTEKPPEIFERAMRLSTEPGDLCYEPFSGSGSQFCAAHNSKRVCFGMEIEPKYVAVALERLAAMGLTPKLATAGAVSQRAD